MNTQNKVPDPIPQGKYVPATRSGQLIFTAGMTPRKNGVLLLSGKVKSSEPLEKYKDAIRQAASNALDAARNMLKAEERITGVLSLSVFINAEQNYTLHPKLADYASEFLYEEIGEAGIGSRAAIGVASLPSDAPVEIQLVVVAG
jgi:enamine deaminase RidA (YjgF/YER057c/UK114 family)